MYGFVAAAGGSIGLLAGGVLTEAISWPWIFFVNVPIGLATALLALRLVDARPGIGLSAGADVPGAVLCTVGLMIGVYAIIGVTEAGWIALRTLGLLAASVVLVSAFVVRQARIANPLMPLRLFRVRTVTGANLVMALLVVGMFSMFFLGALYLQRVLGYSPLQVGLAFLPSSVLRRGRRLRPAKNSVSIRLASTGSCAALKATASCGGTAAACSRSEAILNSHALGSEPDHSGKRQA